MHMLEEAGNAQVLHTYEESKMVDKAQTNPRNEPVDVSGRACAYDDSADILLCFFGYLLVQHYVCILPPHSLGKLHQTSR